jgi:hypothetical protein
MEKSILLAKGNKKRDANTKTQANSCNVNFHLAGVPPIWREIVVRKLQVGRSGKQAKLFRGTGGL